jgi:drug/metabolite transporter (DMT)-like permease
MAARTLKVARSVLGQYLLLGLTWGASFLFIKVGLEGLSPGQVVLCRLTVGAVTLGAVSVVTRQPLPRAPTVWAHLAVVSVLLCVAPFLLFAWAEQQIASGLASIYNATTPLMTMLIALAALPQEHPTRARLAGLLLGFAGVVVVLGPWHGVGGGGLLAQGGCLLATASYGLAFVYLRRFITPLGIAAIPTATVQVGLGALLMLLLAPLTALQEVHLSGRVVASVLVLGAAGTGLAYVWNTNIVSGWGATNASTVTYLTPLVGVLLGIAVLHESVSWNEPVGAVLVVLGIAISQDRLTALSRRTSKLRPWKRYPPTTAKTEPVSAKPAAD